MKRLFLFFIILLLGGAGFVLVKQRELTKQSDAAYDQAEAHVAQEIGRGTTSIDLREFPQLADLPGNLNEVENLQRLNINGTRIADLTDLSRHTQLEDLVMRDTFVVDLTPLAGLAKLKSVDMGGSWVSDLSPLAQLPSLERLDIGDTQIDTLAPVGEIAQLNWLNLYQAYALDGSREHYQSLLQSVPEVFNGRAFETGYVPGPRYLWQVKMRRLSEKHLGQ
ncbi:leucine-rich repeat domain-containing protein [Loktanella sp. S4079]|uniref:leucine-rich repeat domain-containing protein n=1 Tax=Loktanella sp. S4079 TaxID=579483 RepID=UPI0005FA43B3|nr:leucine-rich repeat domain-containing protein [Loktanella sp. S4079]KJZ19767.1 hypothetical protein TW80_02405 [Loktanella sp. S4079]